MESQSNVAATVVPAEQATKPPRSRRQGKSSKTKNLEKFRSRKNTEFMSTYMKELDKKLGLLNTDETGRIEQTISNITITPTKRAIPLSTTTRAVGTTTAIFYSRAVTTWNLNAIEEIATIHQVYRVHLWMTYYKLYLAQNIQSEPRNSEPFVRIQINDDIRELIHSIVETVGLFSIVLDSIGKIETNDSVYHMGIVTAPAEPLDIVDHCSLTILPNNIRTYVETFGNAQTPPNILAHLVQHCSVPGAFIQANNNVLLNGDQIYPAVYGFAELQADIHAYKNLITRIQSRLPKHTFTPVTWGGKAARSGLWSTAVQPIRVVSQFEAQRVEVRNVRARNNQGILEAQQVAPVGAYRYLSNNVHGVRTEFWSSEETPHSETIIGTASLVGEECYLHSRYELTARSAVTISAITSQYSISDAPR